MTKPKRKAKIKRKPTRRHTLDLASMLSQDEKDARVQDDDPRYAQMLAEVERYNLEYEERMQIERKVAQYESQLTREHRERCAMRRGKKPLPSQTAPTSTLLH